MNGRYLETSRGQVRVWVTGDRPGVLVLPGLRASADVVAGSEPEATAVAVLDLPGTGGSVGIGALAAGELAGVVAEVGACLGVHTVVGMDVAGGLAVAVASRVPTCRALRLVDREYLTAFAGSTVPDLRPRGDGTHLLALWNLVRDAHLVLPTAPRQPRPDRDELPSPDRLDRTVVAFAADPGAFAELLMTLAELSPAMGEPAAHLDVEAVGGGEGWRDRLPRGSGTGIPGGGRPAAPVVWRGFVDASWGQAHVRYAGDPAAEPLVMFHSAPGSGSNLEPLMAALSRDFFVVAPDYPGNGESAKPWDADVDIARLAGAMAEVIEQLGLAPANLWGTHTGAVIALDLAIERPDLVRRAVLEAPPLLPAALTAQILDRYLPPLLPDRWGRHLVQGWGMRRDMFSFWPWYDDRPAATRDLGIPSIPDLHAWTLGLLQSGRTYHLSYGAAFRYPTADRLPLLRRPALISAGPTDMLADNLDALSAVAPEGASIVKTAATCWYPDQPADAFADTVRAYREFLAVDGPSDM